MSELAIEVEINPSPQSWGIASQELRALPITGVPVLARLRSGISDSNGISDFFCDEEHTLYVIAGFVTVETERHSADKSLKSVNVEKRFFLSRESKRLLVEGRFMPSDGRGSVSYGLTIRRIGKDRFHVTNG